MKRVNGYSIIEHTLEQIKQNNPNHAEQLETVQGASYIGSGRDRLLRYNFLNASLAAKAPVNDITDIIPKSSINIDLPLALYYNYTYRQIYNAIGELLGYKLNVSQNSKSMYPELTHNAVVSLSKHLDESVGVWADYTSTKVFVVTILSGADYTGGNIIVTFNVRASPMAFYHFDVEEKVSYVSPFIDDDGDLEASVAPMLINVDGTNPYRKTELRPMLGLITAEIDITEALVNARGYVDKYTTPSTYLSEYQWNSDAFAVFLEPTGTIINSIYTRLSLPIFHNNSVVGERRIIDTLNTTISNADRGNVCNRGVGSNYGFNENSKFMLSNAKIDDGLTQWTQYRGRYKPGTRCHTYLPNETWLEHMRFDTDRIMTI